MKYALNMKYNLTVSIVLFQTDMQEIEHILAILMLSKLKLKVFLIDNSPTPFVEKQIPNNDKIEYIFTGKNLGFGRGHNIAIKKSIREADFHLVLNADVSFEASILKSLYTYMKENPDVGLVSPKVFNPDGTMQSSVKLLPTPANLIVRRFIPVKFIQEKLDKRYELRFFNFDRIIDVPYVSGCFMFINCKVLQKVKGFDERFFMYPEDIDLTRRIYNHNRTIFYPHVSIVHEHGKGSYGSKRLLYYHMTSMIKYFNKWGWIFDKGRREINRKILSQFH